MNCGTCLSSSGIGQGAAPIGGVAAIGGGLAGLGPGGAPIAALGGLFPGGLPIGGPVGQLFRSGGLVPPTLFLSTLTPAGPIGPFLIGSGGAPIGLNLFGGGGLPIGDLAAAYLLAAMQARTALLFGL